MVSKYKESYCDELLEYAKGGYLERGDKLPSFSAFAVEEWNIAPSTLCSWQNIHPEFLEAFKKAMQLQKKILIENGLTSKFNAKITQLILMNNHGFSEKRDTTVVDNKSLTNKEVLARLKELEDLSIKRESKKSKK